MKNRPFSDRKITHTFLSHLDNPYYTKAIQYYKATIIHYTTVNTIYIVSVIARITNQLVPCVPRTDVLTITHQ